MHDEHIVKLTHDVNDLLTRYIAIHDDIFRASWRRFIPIPGLFQKINYQQHFIDITNVEITLSAMKVEAAGLYENVSGAGKDCVAALNNYIASLLNSLSVLIKIIEGLKDKSKHKKYNWNEYGLHVHSYEQLREKHAALGVEVNQKWEKYRRATPHDSLSQINDPLLVRADALVQTAHLNGISTPTVLLDEFSILRETDIENWTFILTVAGVFIAATRLRNLRLGEAREQKLMDKVYEHFTRWDSKNADRAFEDCKSFFEKNFDALTKAGHEPRFVASDAIGLWIVWNVLGRAAQTNEERKLVRVVGSMTTHTFFNWWTD